MNSHFLEMPPVTEPVTLTGFKTHARIDDATEDALITSLLVASRQWCESFTRLAFIDQGWALYLSSLPTGNMIDLPRGPLLSVTSITSFDDTNTPTEWNAGAYHVDQACLPSRVVLRDGAVWPDFTRTVNGLKIAYRAGFGFDASAVPEAIKLAIKQLALHWYEYRGEALTSDQPARTPQSVLALLQPYRIVTVGGA